MFNMAATTHPNKSVYSVYRVSYSWINNVTTLILPTLILPVNDLGAPIYWRDLRSTETASTDDQTRLNVGNLCNSEAEPEVTLPS